MFCGHALLQKQPGLFPFRKEPRAGIIWAQFLQVPCWASLYQARNPPWTFQQVIATKLRVREVKGNFVFNSLLDTGVPVLWLIDVTFFDFLSSTSLLAVNTSSLHVSFDRMQRSNLSIYVYHTFSFTQCFGKIIFHTFNLPQCPYNLILDWQVISMAEMKLNFNYENQLTRRKGSLPSSQVLPRQF